MKHLILVLVLIQLSYSQLDPKSAVNLPIPGDFQAGVTSVENMLITDNFGIFVTNVEEQGICRLQTFETESFTLTQSEVTVECIGSVGMVKVDEDSFLLLSSNATNMVVTLYNISSDGSVHSFRSLSEELNSVFMSQSPIISNHNKLYLSSIFYMNPSISSNTALMGVFEFDVKTFELKNKIKNVIDVIEEPLQLKTGKGFSAYAIDYQQLPHDSGIQYILNTLSNNNEDSATYHVFVYFNGTVLNVPIDSDQYYTGLGRAKGSAFGYIVGSIGRQNSNMSFITAVDLAVPSFYNTLQLEGTIASISGHFSGSDFSVFVSTTVLGKGSFGGNIYQLPYSEQGFLLASVSSLMDVPLVAYIEGLGQGDDGEHIYLNRYKNITRYSF